MKNKTLYIVLGVVALAALIYFFFIKKSAPTTGVGPSYVPETKVMKLGPAESGALLASSGGISTTMPTMPGLGTIGTVGMGTPSGTVSPVITTKTAAPVTGSISPRLTTFKPIGASPISTSKPGLTWPGSGSIGALGIYN